MSDKLRQQADADSSANSGERQCVNIASPALEQKVSDEPVSPAISLAVSPSTDENYKTESDGDQSSNQSGSQRSEKPNCYECKHRISAAFSAHSQCKHPKIGDVGQFVELAFLIQGLRGPAMKRLNVSCDSHGFRNGWFMWPMNFDPVWLKTCDGFERKE